MLDDVAACRPFQGHDRPTTPARQPTSRQQSGAFAGPLAGSTAALHLLSAEVCVSACTTGYRHETVLPEVVGGWGRQLRALRCMLRVC